METYAVLLRGVNVTGKNKVPMADLRAALGKAGLSDVQTYIQSGNIVARSGLDPSAVELLVREVIAREIALDITVIARTHQQMERILAGNPFPQDAAERIYFTLLASDPAPALVGELSRLDLTPEQVLVAGSTIYTLYAARYSDSQVNNNFYERRLKVAATTRNFNTMARLVEMGRLIIDRDCG